jgi:hypothetical protein
MSVKLTPGLMHTFARTQLHTDDVEYVAVGLTPEHIADGLFLFSRLGVPFSTAVVDKDEVTLLLPWEAWVQVRDELGAFDEARGYRLITFDTPADLGLVGFIAALSTVLAEAGIPIISISAFTRDHVLVQQEDLDHAVEILSEFIFECQARLGA